jgi:integrase
LRLAPRRRPYFQTVAAGVALGYRRLEGGAAGTWSVRAADGAGSSWQKRVGFADDLETADGALILDFWQAIDAAKKLARAGDGPVGGAPVTVAEAVDSFEHDLRARGAGLDNVGRIRHNPTPALASKLVSILTPRELRGWRDHMVKAGMAPASADRTARMLSAALSLASRDDARITNSIAWKTGLRRLPGTERARANVILSDDTVRAIVAEAHTIESAFGLLVEILAISGARTSQVLRLEIGDLEATGSAPRLQVPSSRKGRNRQIQRKALPISPTLAAMLRTASTGRPDSDPLLVREDGWASWRVSNLFRQVTAALGLDVSLTLYSLRHSSVVRMLMSGAPLQLVASSHDTSAAIISRHYAKYIVDNSDEVLRRGMLDIGAAPLAPNVVSLSVGRK